MQLQRRYSRRCAAQEPIFDWALTCFLFSPRTMVEPHCHKQLPNLKLLDLEQRPKLGYSSVLKESRVALFLFLINTFTIFSINLRFWR